MSDPVKLFETVAEYQPQEIIPPPKAYEPCPEYGLQFGSAEDYDAAREIMCEHIRGQFPEVTDAELEPYRSGLVVVPGHPDFPLLRTTRTCFFEQNLPPFVRLPLKGL